VANILCRYMFRYERSPIAFFSGMLYGWCTRKYFSNMGKTIHHIWWSEVCVSFRRDWRSRKYNFLLVSISVRSGEIWIRYRHGYKLLQVYKACFVQFCMHVCLKKWINFKKWWIFLHISRKTYLDWYVLFLDGHKYFATKKLFATSEVRRWHR
jgi:hypothetical protein